MISTIIFDFDGTLANTNKLIINSFKHIYSVFCNDNDNCNEEYIMSTFGEPLLTTMNRDFGKFNIEDVLACYREYQVERFNDEVFLYDTVYETLEHLKSKGIKMGIVTSRMRKSTLKALEDFKITKYFDVVVSADDTEKHKPNKEPLIKAINDLNSKIDETLYVGDSKFDMECAINAGVTPVLVGWQTNSLELSTKYNVKNVINKMCELNKIAEQ